MASLGCWDVTDKVDDKERLLLLLLDRLVLLDVEEDREEVERLLREVAFFAFFVEDGADFLAPFVSPSSSSEQEEEELDASSSSLLTAAAYNILHLIHNLVKQRLFLLFRFALIHSTSSPSADASFFFVSL